MDLQSIPPDQLTQKNIEKLLNANSYSVEFTFNYHNTLIIGILSILLLLRVSDLSYNTLFIDEAIYVTVGHEIINGRDSGSAEAWMFGSYLYPIYAASADALGGEAAVRVSSVILNMLAVWLVFTATIHLFDFRSAVWALIICGTSGICINLSRLAVYDSMGVMLAALTVYLVIMAAQNDTPVGNRYAAGAGLVFGLCFCVKYIGILLLPAVVMIGVNAWLVRRQSLGQLLKDSRLYWFWAALILVIGVEYLLSSESVIQAFRGENSTQLAPRLTVVWSILQDLGIVLALACFGLALVAYKTFSVNRRPFHVAVVGLVMIMLGVSLVMMPLYHVYSANIRALWKHNVYTLVLLAPFAGYALDWIVQQVRATWHTRQNREWRLLLAACAVVVLLFAVSMSLDTVWGFSYSWPNVRHEISYLEAQDMVNLADAALVLSTTSTVYEYYLIDDPGGSRWFSNWYFEYKGVDGLEGIQLAVADCAIDLVILDDFFTADINDHVEPALVQAGYIQIYSKRQRLNSGDDVVIRMYVPAVHNNCSWRATHESTLTPPTYAERYGVPGTKPDSPVRNGWADTIYRLLTSDHPGGSPHPDRPRTGR